MPRLFHKNRSSHSVLSSHDVDDERERDRNTARYQPSPTDSPIHSPAFPPSYPYSNNTHDHGDDNELDQGYGRPYRLEEVHAHQLGHPSPSHSQRIPGHINTNLPQPTINLVGPAHSTPTSAIDEETPDAFYRQAHPHQHPPPKEDKKKRRFFGLGSSSKESAAPAKLGRSISVRRREQIPDPGRFSSQQEWSSSHASPTDDFDDYSEGTVGAHDPSIKTNPPAPDKEPLRSPGFPPAISRQDYSHQGVSTGQAQNRRSPSDRQAQPDLPAPSTWSRTSSSIHHHTFSESSQSGAPPSATSVTGSHHLGHRSPSDNLNQPWQEQIPSRPSSSQSLEPPPPVQIPKTHETHHVRSSSSQASSLSQFTQSSMVHPPPPTGPTRRPSEAQQDHQTSDQVRPGTYQPYAQGVQDRNILPSNVPLPNSAQLAPQSQAYRNSAVSTMQATGHEQGRSTPPPSRSRDDLSSMDLNALQVKHDELRKLADTWAAVQM